jgi:hypothetical protein
MFREMKITAGLLLAMCTTGFAQNVAPDEVRSIAKDAYIYSYAPIASYGTWSKQATMPDAPEYVGGFNVFRNYSQAFTPENKDIVTPNNDTPYSWAWLDLRAEPIVLSVPKVPKDRYYVMQLIDLFTYNFGYVGVRATGFDAGNYLIAGPGWSGDKPKGITKVIQAETEVVGILGRTSLGGPDDVKNVKAIQTKYRLTPLSAFLKTPSPKPVPMPEFPSYDPAKATSHDFIGYINFLLQFAQPTVPSEKDLMTRFEKLASVRASHGMPRRWILRRSEPSIRAWLTRKPKWRKSPRRHSVRTACSARANSSRTTT